MSAGPVSGRQLRPSLRSRRNAFWVLTDRKATRHLDGKRSSGAEAEATSQKGEAERASFFNRIRHWWHHAPEKRAPAPSPAHAINVSPEKEPKHPAEPPPLDRLTVMEWLWGKGYVLPGGEAFVLDLVKPSGLGPSMSLLDLSAGLGGPARTIAKSFHTYVTGMERDYQLAQAGQRMSVAAGMERRAEIIHYNPEDLELRKHRFDAILGRLVTFALRDKERFLRVLSEALKPGGKLMLTDFVVEPGRLLDPALLAWAEHEPIPPVLWTLQQYEDCLAGLGFDVRIAEDRTDAYCQMIVSAWSQMIQERDLRSLPRHDLGVVVDEAEFWANRVAALERGGLRFMRLFALAPR